MFGFIQQAWFAKTSLIILSNASFRNLWLASLLSMMGSHISRIGLILYVFRQSDAVSGLALFVVLEALPGVLIAPITGIIVDRFNKSRLMVWADLARLFLLGLVLLWPTVIIIYITMVLQSSATVMFQTAKSGSIPLIVGTEKVPDANSIDQATTNLVMVTGPLVGAELFFRFGLAVILIIDALSYLLSALLVNRLDIRRPDSSQTGTRSIWEIRGMWSGWTYITRDILVLYLTFLFSVSIFCGALWLPLAPFFIRDFLEGSEHILGLQLGVAGIGAVLGAIWARQLMRDFGKGATLFGGLLLEGAAMTVYSLVSVLFWSTSIMLVWGIAVSLIVVPFYSILQTIVQDNFLGRVFSIVKLGECCALLAAMGIAIISQEAVSIQRIFFGAGIIYASLIAVSSLTPGGQALLAMR